MKTLDPVFPITALQKKTAEVKEAARDSIIRITENGVGAYIFASEAAFERRVREETSQALEEALLAHAIERGRADISAGRFITGDAAWDEIEKRASAHA